MKNFWIFMVCGSIALAFSVSLSAQALWKKHNGPTRTSLYERMEEEPRTWREHDIILIRINQNRNARREDTFESEREFEVETSLDEYIRVGSNLTLLPSTADELALSGDATLGSEAEGRRRRRSTFTDLIAAEVTQVMPGYDPKKGRGQLKIRAFNESLLGGDLERVEFTGRIEVAHIEEGDVIDSSRVFGQRTNYYGNGDISDSASMGWFSKALSTVWPF